MRWMNEIDNSPRQHRRPSALAASVEAESACVTARAPHVASRHYQSSHAEKSLQKGNTHARHVKGRLLSAVSVATLLLAYIPVHSASAQNAQTKAPASHATSDAINQDAIDALNSMGNYLRTLKSFQIHAVTTKDDVLDDGQLIQFDTHVDMLARMPDRLRVAIVNARQDRMYFYDGKTFTLYAKRVNYYASMPAPPTVGKLASELSDKWGMELPLEDLFYWGGPQSKVSEIKGAIDVGVAEVGGVTCEHYAFRQPGLDWQIWIQQGDFPLPRKLVITTLSDEARPQYSSVIDWNLAPSFNEAAFQFEPPSNAQKITFAGAPK
jgi:hypothetical protein